jgi:hypothetical protein
MKTLFSLLLICLSAPLFAQTSFTVVYKQHESQAQTMADRPYGQDDNSFGLFADLFEGAGGWRLGASYLTDATGVPGVKSVITPEIGLLALDGVVEGGVSALMDYVELENGDTDWGDVYFQLALGLQFPLSQSMSIGIHAYYPFEDLKGLSDFDTGDVEYGGALRIRF